jgi:hypothetical protein
VFEMAAPIQVPPNARCVPYDGSVVTQSVENFPIGLHVTYLYFPDTPLIILLEIFQKLSLFQISMFRFVYILKTHYATETFEHFCLWSSRKARENQEINVPCQKGVARPQFV